MAVLPATQVIRHPPAQLPPVATIVTFTPLQPPTRTRVEGAGRLLSHRCEDVLKHRHQQRLPLGSVRGMMYLDALCLHCGTHFVWVEDEAPPAGA